METHPSHTCKTHKITVEWETRFRFQIMMLVVQWQVKRTCAILREHGTKGRVIYSHSQEICRPELAGHLGRELSGDLGGTRAWRCQTGPGDVRRAGTDSMPAHKPQVLGLCVDLGSRGPWPWCPLACAHRVLGAMSLDTWWWFCMCCPAVCCWGAGKVKVCSESHSQANMVPSLSHPTLYPHSVLDYQPKMWGVPVPHHLMSTFSLPDLNPSPCPTLPQKRPGCWGCLPRAWPTKPQTSS